MRGIQGELRLLTAILENTVRDIFSSDVKVSLEAYEYLLEDEGEPEFSFNWICLQLDREPKEVRKNLLKYIQDTQVSYKENHRTAGHRTNADSFYLEYVDQSSGQTGFNCYHEFEWTEEDREVA